MFKINSLSLISAVSVIFAGFSVHAAESFSSPRPGDLNEIVSLNRLWNDPDHFYTSDCREMMDLTRNHGYKIERNAGYVSLSALAGTVPLYRMYNGKDHFYTVDQSEKDGLITSGAYHLEGIVGFVSTSPRKGFGALYRSFNPGTGDHFYTESEKEWDDAVSAGWKKEGISAYVWLKGKDCPR